MSRIILQKIIEDFHPDSFVRFFRKKSRTFAPRVEELEQYNNSDFINGKKIGELNFEQDERMVICTFGVTKALTERSGKKAQYEQGKKILRDNQYDAGIFIFNDATGNFRFSLIYASYLGRRRDWSSFRRFTYYVSKELTNKTFLYRIGDGDFATLEKIKDAFSVEKVTKAFYTDIANWYFWAVQNVVFPKDAEKEENGRNIAVIRLITRLIFIWFMKERGLIRQDLFKKQKVATLLKNISPNETTYYKAILQNLFFATLNTKIKERKFRFTKSYHGVNRDYMDHRVYRYEDYFKNKDDMIEIFKDIPFLNGGLFDCLDRRETHNGKNIDIRIDGFTDKEKGLRVPNFLFFLDEKYVNLNREYGTKNKKYKVKGLINILTSYNFTIDENVPDDQEVALDPELLGKVFENLLASYNPETATTARKATGSYYTPREIVDYMVIQSLKEYLKSHLPNIRNLDNKIDKLFSKTEEGNPFDIADTMSIVSLIDNIRIVDPAVGSGAFPMGILNRLVFILSKLDPHNEMWKKTQIKAIEESVPDPRIKEKIIEQIVQQFAEKDFNYGRKLYLIQKCIYGVDIQQIAVEIAKLRFFIALLVDERIDKNKDNWGIEPLPNLEFKLMQGNSLISEFMGIDLDAETTSSTDGQLFKDELDDLINQFQQKKSEFQNEPDRLKKEKLKDEVDNCIIRIFEEKLKKQKSSYFTKLEYIENKFSKLPNKEERNKIIEKEKQKLHEKTGFNLEETEKKLKEYTAGRKRRPFFPWKLYFAEVFQEKGGFDVVIANPPYVGEKGHKRIFREVKISEFGKRYYKRKMDYFYFFFHKSIDIARINATVSFITTNYYITADGALFLRTDFKQRTTLLKLINFNELRIFDSAKGQHNMITILRKGLDTEFNVKTCVTGRIGNATSNILNQILSWNDKSTNYYIKNQNELYDGNNNYIRGALQIDDKENLFGVILNKIKEGSLPLLKIKNVNQGVLTGADKVTPKHIKNGLTNSERGRGVYVLSDDEVEELNLNDKEVERIKCYYKNSNIYRYFTHSRRYKRNLVYVTRDMDINKYPHIKKHLFEYEKIIKARSQERGEMQAALKLGKWWVIFAARAGVNFDGPKIVCPQRSPSNTFGYNEEQWYASADVYYITDKDKNDDVGLKYIITLLNSKLYYVWLYFRGKRKGELLELFYTPLSEIPIKKISPEQQKPFIQLVDQILSITKDDYYLDNPGKKAKVKDLKKEIDKLVYELYELTHEEIETLKKFYKEKLGE